MSELYLQGFEYAKENGEIDKFRESKNLNRECTNDIKRAIADNTEYLQYGKSVNVGKALTEVLAGGYDVDRVAFVTAATVYNAEWDGRYDKGVKEWAKQQFETLPTELCNKAVENAVRDNDGTCHPIVFNDFAKAVAAEQELTERVYDTIKLVQDFYFHSDAAMSEEDLQEISNDFLDRNVEGIKGYAADINDYQECQENEMSALEIQEARGAVEAINNYASLLVSRRDLSDDERKTAQLEGEISILDDNGNVLKSENYTYADVFAKDVREALETHGEDNISVNDYSSTCVYAQELALYREEQGKQTEAKPKKKDDLDR